MFWYLRKFCSLSFFQIFERWRVVVGPFFFIQVFCREQKSVFGNRCNQERENWSDVWNLGWSSAGDICNQKIFWAISVRWRLKALKISVCFGWLVCNQNVWVFSVCATNLIGRILFAPYRRTCHIFTKWFTILWHVLCNWGRRQKRKRSKFFNAVWRHSVGFQSLGVLVLADFKKNRFRKFLCPKFCFKWFILSIILLSEHV